MSGSTDRHGDVVSIAANAFRDAYGKEFGTGPEAHVAVAGNQYRPAILGAKLMAVCQNMGHARVFAHSKYSAAMIDDLLSCPVKEQTRRGAIPYRSGNPLQTSSGGRVVQDSSKSQPAVEFIAGEGTELTWEDDTVLLAFDSDGEQALLGDLPAGVFIARQEDDAGDGWVIEDGSGAEVARVATAAALDEEYVAVLDWFQPDRITFQGEVTIHYPDSENNEDLATYRKQPPVNHGTESLTTFLEQTTTRSEGEHLPVAEVFARYEAWQAGFAGELASRPRFGEQLADHGDIKRIPDKGGAYARVLCDRVWRWHPAVSRQV